MVYFVRGLQRRSRDSVKWRLFEGRIIGEAQNKATRLYAQSEQYRTTVESRDS